MIQKSNVTDMPGEDHRLDAFDYALPEGRIARFPPERRDGGRLLVGHGCAWQDRLVADLPQLFQAGDLLVVNDTRVLAARLFGHRSSGGRVEILVLSAKSKTVSAMVRPGRKIKDGEVISLLDKSGSPSTYCAEVGPSESDGARTVVLSDPPGAVLSACGHLPIPPYLEREASETDEVRYQTIFAEKPGAIAAPTASLHLTHPLLEQIRAAGAEVATVTLHVGPGTFRNLRPSDLDRGSLHIEPYTIPKRTKAAIDACRSVGGRVIAVGTTVTRTLESAATPDRTVEAGEGNTDLFIQPGYTFRVVDRLLTNLHLPRSSLLMLVSAFGGHQHVMAGYAHAVAHGYRFYSYGDAMFLEPGGDLP